MAPFNNIFIHVAALNLKQSGIITTPFYFLYQNLSRRQNIGKTLGTYYITAVSEEIKKMYVLNTQYFFYFLYTFRFWITTISHSVSKLNTYIWFIIDTEVCRRYNNLKISSKELSIENPADTTCKLIGMASIVVSTDGPMMSEKKEVGTSLAYKCMENFVVYSRHL